MIRMSKQVTITGAAGGLGRSCVDYFRARGYRVVALARKPGPGTRAGDLTDLGYVREALADADAIIHCAGLASPVGPWSAFEKANVIATRNVLDASRARKFVHISTPSLYFDGTPHENIEESSPLPTPHNNYARSKFIADEIVTDYALAHPDVSVGLLRPRAIVGPYDRTIVPRMMRIMKRGVFPLPNGGRALIDLTAAENVARACELVLESGETFHAEIFNITNKEPQTLRTLAETLAGLMNVNPKFLSIPMGVLRPIAGLAELLAGEKEPIISKYAIESIGTTQTLSVAKAERVLGYRPIVSLEDVFASVVGPAGLK